MADAEVRREARIRLRRELRRRLTSRAARRRRRVQCIVSALSWPLLLGATAWMVVQLGFRPVSIVRPLDDRPWWLILIRDDALRHLTAAELTLSRRTMDGPPDLLFTRMTSRIEAAEKAGAPQVYTEWLRLRACLWSRDPARRGSPRLPPEAHDHLVALRRLQPEEPLWEFLLGAAAAVEGCVDEATETMAAAVTRPEPFCAPVLPKPWRWLAQPALGDPISELGLVSPACRLISEQVVTTPRGGDYEQTEVLLSLLSRMAAKLSNGRRLPLAGEYPVPSIGDGWAYTEPGPLFWQGRTARDLAQSDPARWVAAVRLNIWQGQVQSYLSGSSRAPQAWSWGLLPAFFWRRAALALLVAIGMAAGHPCVRAARLPSTRAGPRALDLALAASPVVDAVAVLAAIVGGVTAGVLWNRAHWLLIDVPLGVCYDCWLANSMDLVAGRSLVTSGLVAALVAAPVVVAVLYLASEAWTRWRLGRLARRAGSGVWDRPVKGPRLTRALVWGAIPRSVLVLALLAAVLTIGRQQSTTGGHQLDLILWPPASAEIVTEDRIAHMDTTAAIASVLSAADLDQAIRRTPPIVRREIAGRLSGRREDSAEATFWERVARSSDADER